MTFQTSPGPEYRPSAWDVIFGIILVLLGIFVLGNTVVATAVSVLVLGWAAIFGGIAVIIGGVMARRAGWVLTGLISGALMILLGVLILRNPLAGAFWLTLMIGATFLARGIVTLIAGFTLPFGRLLFIISGAISLLLGLIVVFNLGTMTLTLLGILLGIDLIFSGLMTAFFDRSTLWR